MTPPLSTKASVASSKWSEKFNSFYRNEKEFRKEKVIIVFVNVSRNLRKENDKHGKETANIKITPKQDSPYDYRAFYSQRKLHKCQVTMTLLSWNEVHVLKKTCLVEQCAFKRASFNTWHD